MSQVAATLEISKDNFMVLMREGQIMILKEDIVLCQYISIHRYMLGQREIDNLNQFIKKLSIEDRPVDTSRGCQNQSLPGHEDR